MVYIAQQSFGFGEIDPNMRAQHESNPYKLGCQSLENAYLSTTGSAIKRWGSIQYTGQAGTKKVFEFYDGYNNRFLIADIPMNVGLPTETRGYRIINTGNDASPPEYKSKHTVSLAEEYVKDVATSGNDLFVLTLDGIYKHSIIKDINGNFTFSRSHAEIDADLIASVPPTTFTSNAVSPTEITTSDHWFHAEDVGDLYKLCEKADPDNHTTSPRWGIVASVINEKKAIVSTVDAVHLDGSSSAFTNGQLFIKNHGFASSTQTNVVAVKWYRGTVSANYYSGEDADGTTVYVKSIDENTIELYSSSSLNTNNKIIITSSIGQSPSTYLLKLGNSTGLPSFDDAVTTPSRDWVGPYRHWQPWYYAVWTNYDYTTASETPPTGVNASAWTAWAQGETLKWDTGTAGEAWGTNTSNVSQRLGAIGGIAKAEHYKGNKLLKTTYFQINWHPFMGNDGADNDATPRLTHIAGPPLSASGASTGIKNNVETLIWHLATSEDQSGVSQPLIDLNPYAKNGWNPSLLVRAVDSNPDGNSEGITYPVAKIGSRSRPALYSNNVLHFGTATGDENVLRTNTFISNCPIHLSVVVGEIAPPLSSQVFRIGIAEIDGSTNTPTDKLDKGNGPSAYWKITGEAFSPQSSENPNYENKNLLNASELELHQDRLFVSSISPYSFGTDLGGLKPLQESQNLGLTIFASKTGNYFNFSTGVNSGDGLSFQLFSKIGGKVSWLHSQFNQLFVGTNEEEFVITDIPMTPASINISKQSNYGSLLESQPALLGGDVVYINETGKSILSIVFNRNSQRYESQDLLQFAKHIVKSDTIKRIAVISSETPLLFALTDNNKLWCFTRKTQNNVYGWSEWIQPNMTFQEIVATQDNNGNPSLLVRYTGLGLLTENAIMITTDSSRLNYHIDAAEEIDVTNGNISSVTASSGTVLKGHTVSCVAIKTNGDQVYVGDFLCHATTRVIDFNYTINDCDKVIIGLPYKMKIAPNIPEVMLPGKGSTLGREKNISRLRILFNQALGAVASGYGVFPVPLDTIDAIPTDSPGFYSIPVVGQYGPQPTVNIEQSAPYSFEVSGYNAEYDFGD